MMCFQTAVGGIATIVSLFAMAVLVAVLIVQLSVNNVIEVRSLIPNLLSDPVESDIRLIIILSHYGGPCTAAYNRFNQNSTYPCEVTSTRTRIHALETSSPRPLFLHFFFG